MMGSPVQETDALDETESANPEPAQKKGRSVPKVTKKTAVVGAAIGIGSAALVAALLYANRNNKG
jgi:hypothetical protein